MAFKSFNRNLSFADLEMAGILEKTRTQSYLGEIDRVVDWPLAHRADGSERHPSRNYCRKIIR